MIVRVLSNITRGSKKWTKETPKIAEKIRKTNKRYLPFGYDTDFFFFLSGSINLCVRSMVVPKGQTNPQKNLPKMKVKIMVTIEKSKNVIRVRVARLTIKKTSGSNLKKRFWKSIRDL
jgi:hypothetical protein